MQTQVAENIQIQPEASQPTAETGYNLLREVSFLQHDLAEYGQFRPETVEYAYCNELTAAMEAVTGRHLSVVSQKFDPEQGVFLAFGRPVIDMVKNGITESSIPDFERERRWIELQEELELNDAAESGKLESHYLVTISPPPFEANPQQAKAQGYDADGLMLRVHDMDESGNKLLYQMRMSGGSIMDCQAILNRFGYQLPDGATSADILKARLWLPKINYAGGIGEVFIPDDYQDLEAKRRFVVEQSQPYIGHLVELNKSLAAQIHAGEISNQTAASYKKQELIRTWSAFACLVNPSQAEKIFGKKAVATFVNDIKIGGSIHQLLHNANLSSMIENSRPVFAACGGTIELSEGGNLMEASLKSLANLLFGSEAGEDVPCDVKTNCPKCHRKNITARIHKGKITCLSCNGSASTE